MWLSAVGPVTGAVALLHVQCKAAVTAAPEAPDGVAAFAVGADAGERFTFVDVCPTRNTVAPDEGMETRFHKTQPKHSPYCQV